jgi:hypothetical protein
MLSWHFVSRLSSPNMTKFKGNYNYVLLDSMWHNFPVWKRPKIVGKQPREGYLTPENRKGSTRETPEGTTRETPGRYSIVFDRDIFLGYASPGSASSKNKICCS